MTTPAFTANLFASNHRPAFVTLAGGFDRAQIMRRAMADCCRLRSTYENGKLTVVRVFNRSLLAQALRDVWALAKRNHERHHRYAATKVAA